MNALAPAQAQNEGVSPRQAHSLQFHRMAAIEVQAVVTTTNAPKSGAKAGAELDVSALDPDADGDGNISPLEKEVMR